MAFSLFTACNNDKGANEKKADYREKDDYGRNEEQSDDRSRKDEDSENSDYTSNDGWSERDISKFNDECMSGFGNNQEYGKKICPCALEKFQKKYKSYSELEAKSSEAEGKRIGAQCKDELGLADNNNSNNNEDIDNDKSDYADGWTRSDEDKFVDECFGTASKNVGRTRANQYCDCMLAKIKKMYSSYNEANLKLGGMSQDQINRLAEDCNNQ